MLSPLWPNVWRMLFHAWSASRDASATPTQPLMKQFTVGFEYSTCCFVAPHAASSRTCVHLLMNIYVASQRWGLIIDELTLLNHISEIMAFSGQMKSQAECVDPCSCTGDPLSHWTQTINQQQFTFSDCSAPEHLLSAPPPLEQPFSWRQRFRCSPSALWTLVIYLIRLDSI